MKKKSLQLTPQSVSLISTFFNLCLAVGKLIFGFLTSSIALLADGIHSGLDILSSFVTFLGLKISKRPVDEKHPYGYWKAESLAGFLVSLLLMISGIWILYEAVERILNKETISLSIGAISIIGFSILINEVLARLKFYYGAKFKALSLLADAEHSRADAISSVGVLLGLILVRYYQLADAIIAILIGIYILFEALQISKEITESLLDVANKEVEDKIRKICNSHKIEISELRTRKIGSFNFAELKIKLPPKLNIEKVQKISGVLEERLLSNIPELKEITISVEAYNLAKTTVLPRFGKKIGSFEGFEKIGPKKLGQRAIIPIEENKLASVFGTKEYLVIDYKNGKILRKDIMKNPYFEIVSPERNIVAAHGTRFAKAVRADIVYTYQIGQNAIQSLENFGIKVKTVDKDLAIDDILKIILENSKNLDNNKI